MESNYKKFNEVDHSYYDSPINLISQQMDGFRLMIEEEKDRQIVRAVQKIAIDIDKESLIEALNRDRKRYEAAYQKGWNDCEEHYASVLKEIQSKLDQVLLTEDSSK
jgi:hypothetical protein